MASFVQKNFYKLLFFTHYINLEIYNHCFNYNDIYVHSLNNNFNWNDNWFNKRNTEIKDFFLTNNWVNNNILDVLTLNNNYLYYEYDGIFSIFYKNNDQKNKIFNMDYWFPKKKISLVINNINNLEIINYGNQIMVGLYNNGFNLLFNNYNIKEIKLKAPLCPKKYKDKDYSVCGQGENVLITSQNLNVLEDHRFLTMINNSLVNMFHNDIFFSLLSDDTGNFLNTLLNVKEINSHYGLWVFNKNNFSEIYLVTYDSKDYFSNLLNIKNFKGLWSYQFILKKPIRLDTIKKQCIFQQKSMNILLFLSNINVKINMNLCKTFFNEMAISFNSIYSYKVEEYFCESNMAYNALVGFHFFLFFTLQFFLYFSRFLLFKNNLFLTKLYYVFYKLFHNGNPVIITLGLTVSLFTSSVYFYPERKFFINYPLHITFFIFQTLIILFQNYNFYQQKTNKKKKFFINFFILEEILFKFFKKKESLDDVYQFIIDGLPNKKSAESLMQMVDTDNIISLNKIYIDYKKNFFEQDYKENFLKFLEDLYKKVESNNPSQENNDLNIFNNSLFVLYYYFDLAHNNNPNPRGLFSIFFSNEQYYILDNIIKYDEKKDSSDNSFLKSTVKPNLQNILICNQSQILKIPLTFNVVVFNEISVYLVNMALWAIFIMGNFILNRY
jgi:hypothetical protein